MNKQNVRKIIAKLPYWIRLTKKCPFKNYGIQAPNKPEQYFGFLRAFYGVDQDFDRCILAAVHWVRNEQRERAIFKNLVKIAPPDVISQYGSSEIKTAYQDQENRNRFLQILAEFMRGKDVKPKPDGFSDHPKGYHKNRGIVMPKVDYRSSNNARLPYIQIRPNSYVQNYC